MDESDLLSVQTTWTHDQAPSQLGSRHDSIPIQSAIQPVALSQLVLDSPQILTCFTVLPEYSASVFFSAKLGLGSRMWKMAQIGQQLALGGILNVILDGF